MKQDFSSLKEISNTLELRLSGNDIRPNSLSLRDMASILTSFDDALRPMLIKDYPEIDFTGNYIGVREISVGSISHRFDIMKHNEEVRVTYLKLVRCLRDKSIDELPPESTAAIRRLSGLGNKLNCTTSFGFFEPSEKRFISLVKLDSLKPTPVKKLKSYKVLYGKLVKLGDDENPKANIRLINGEMVSSVIKDKDIRKYREFLWENVKVTGTALISSKTYKIVSFNLESMIPFNLLSIDDTIKSINRILS